MLHDVRCFHLTLNTGVIKILCYIINCRMETSDSIVKLKEFAMAALISNQAWMAFKNIAMNHMIFRL